MVAGRVVTAVPESMLQLDAQVVRRLLLTQRIKVTIVRNEHTEMFMPGGKLACHGKLYLKDIVCKESGINPNATQRYFPFLGKSEGCQPNFFGSQLYKNDPQTWWGAILAALRLRQDE